MIVPVIVPVYMYAFNDHKGVIRYVEIIEDVTTISKDISSILELVFYWGQNIHQPRECYSVSVGDVIAFNNKYYMILNCGFKEMNREEFEVLEVPTSFTALKESTKLEEKNP